MSKEFYTALGNTVKWPFLSQLNFPPPGSITYDDVLLMPSTDTKIESRRSVNLSVQFGPYKLRTPIITAPMDTISGEQMIRTMNDLGAIGTLPRNDNFDSTLTLCEKLSRDQIPCLYALGLNDALNQARELKERGAKMILLDVAHGGMEQVKKTASEIKNILDLSIVAGNIVSYPQAIKYRDAGIDIARVGVGPGGACKTRLVAGTGFPQLSAIFETTSAGIFVIADGGIKHPGDVAKALAAGANMVMIGSLFAGTKETPGEVENGQKQFRGQASIGYMEDHNVVSDGFRASEGVEVMVPAKGSVREVVDNITGGLRSAMSYTGAKDIESLQSKAVFTFASPAAQQESRPYMDKKA